MNSEVSLLKRKGGHLLSNSHAFTLIELVVVLLIFGAVAALLMINLGTFTYWKEEGFVRRISESAQFLYHQAVIDQAFYKMEFNLDQGWYRIGVVRPEDSEESRELAELSSDAGLLSLELSAFISPNPPSSATLIPPPSMPSLFEPVEMPDGMRIEDIRTMRGVIRPGDGITPYILFSPRGFTEFAVIHLRTSSNAPISIVFNPFTGLVDIFRSYKDFEWTWGRKEE